MKRIILALLFVLVLSKNIYGEDYLKDFNTATIENIAEEKADISFKELFNEIVTGQADKAISRLIENIKYKTVREVQNNLQDIKAIIVLCLLLGLVQAVGGELVDKNIVELTVFIGNVFIISIALLSFKEMSNILIDTISDTVDIINGAIPLMTSVMAMGGKTIEAMGIIALMMLVTDGLISAINLVVVPLLTLGILVKMINLISEREMLDKLSSLIFQISQWLIKGASMLFIFIIGLEKICGGSVGSFFGKSTKAIIKMIPVVGDVYSGGADIATGAISLVNNGIVLSIIIVIAACYCVPLIKVLIIAMLYKLLAALIEPISSSETVEIIDTIGEGGKLVLGTMFSVGGMFILGILIGVSKING